MTGVYFDEKLKLRCDCVGAVRPIDEFPVSLTTDGKLVIQCPECLSEIVFDGVSISLPPPPSEMTITEDQAKYWAIVALKDIKEGNTPGARNVLRWLQENGAAKYGEKVYVELLEASR